MSHKEQLMQVAADVPEWQAEHVLLLLPAILKALDDAADDAFCVALHERYLANPDKGEGTPIEEVAARLGVVLE